MPDGSSWPVNQPNACSAKNARCNGRTRAERAVSAVFGVWARSSETRFATKSPWENGGSWFPAPTEYYNISRLGVQILRKSSGQESMGALVTLRDVESRRQLERQLDFSTRLAAISRLTGGVAHEIKNPLNAMALHLEMLKSRLSGQQPEIDVIGREIKRLDSVVKTFLNFNRPVDLKYKPIDFNELVKTNPGAGLGRGPVRRTSNSKPLLKTSFGSTETRIC